VHLNKKSAKIEHGYKMSRNFNLIFFIILLIFSANVFAYHDNKLQRDFSLSVLPLETIIEKALSLHDGRVIEAELDPSNSGGYVYSVNVLDHDGVIWELFYDAVNGDLISRVREEE